MFKAIIFDKDGVLLDLEATWLNSAIAMTHHIAGLTQGTHPPERFQKIIGINEATRKIDADGLFAAGSMALQFAAICNEIPELTQLLLHNHDIKSQLKDVFLEARDETLSGIGTVPNGDVQTPLAALKARGFKMAVLTNDSTHSATNGCRDIGIEGYFETIIGFDSGFGSKPEPDGFLAICERLSVKPGQAIMVGDTYADRHAASRAGAGAFIGISAIYPETPKALEGVSHLLPDLAGLPDLIDRLMPANS